MEKIIKDKKLEKLIKKEGDSKIFEAFGFKCVIMRMEHSGHLCGYVGIPRNHIAYGKDYGYYDIDEEDTYKYKENYINFAHKMNNIEVHGGLTYSNNMVKGVDIEGLRWFGFDTAHCDDLCPYYDRPISGSIYRDMKYVEKETIELAKQLSEIN